MVNMFLWLTGWEEAGQVFKIIVQINQYTRKTVQAHLAVLPGKHACITSNSTKVQVQTNRCTVLEETRKVFGLTIQFIQTKGLASQGFVYFIKVLYFITVL